MAEKAKPENTSRMVSKSVFETLVSSASGFKAEMDEARGELGAFTKNAEEEHGINRKAFKLYLSIYKMDQAKLADFLRSFDHYRKLGKLNDLAGKDLFVDDDALKTEAAARGKDKDDDQPPVKH